MQRIIIKEDISNWHLINGTIQCSISKVTGSLTGYWNLSTGGKYIEKGNDWYEVENRVLNPASSSEEKDRVIKVSLRRISPEVITIILSCRNQLLSKKGISLIKRYSFKRGDNKLIKEVSFVNHRNNNWFVRWFSQLELTRSFQKGGCYYTPWSGQGIPAETIQKPEFYKDLTNPGLCDHRAAAFMNTAKGYGIAHYRFKVKKKFSYFLAMFDKETLCFNPAGWSFGVYGDFLPAKGVTSAEVHYMLYKKDNSDFLRQYNNLPEILELTSYTSQEWLADVKLVMFPYPAGVLDQVLTRVKNWEGPSVDKDGRIHVPPEGIVKFRDICDKIKGYIMVPFYYWPYEGYFGDLPTDRQEDAMMSKHINLLKKRCPQIKVSLYTLTWFIDERTKLYQSHPDWVIRGKDKSPTFKKELLKITHPPVPLCMNQILASKQYFLGRVTSIMKKFNIDWFYMDWTGPSVETPDWSRRCVSTWWDWYRFYQDVRKRIRHFGDDKAFFTNYPNAMPADCTFMELPHDMWRNPNDIKGDWRVLSDYLETSKLWQRGGRWVSPLYWRHDLDIRYEPAIDRRYVNYLLTFGFMPNFPAWLDYEFLLLRIPYIEAAFQLRDTKLIDADISPCWRREKTMVEAYTLSLDKACLIPVINHDKKAVKATISADRDRLDISPDRFTYTWLMKVKDASSIKKVTPFVVDHVKLLTNEKLPSRITYQLKLQPEELNIIMITQVPGFVYSVNGQRTQILLPSTSGVSINGKSDNNQKKGSLIVNSRQKSCEILVVYPFVNTKPKLYVDGKETRVVKQYIMGKVFLKVIISKGRHLVEVRRTLKSAP